jgi:hypothetical protein
MRSRNPLHSRRTNGELKQRGRGGRGGWWEGKEGTCAAYCGVCVTVAAVVHPTDFCSPGKAEKRER